MPKTFYQFTDVDFKARYYTSLKKLCDNEGLQHEVVKSSIESKGWWISNLNEDSRQVEVIIKKFIQ